jgi:hypothetical protein
MVTTATAPVAMPPTNPTNKPLTNLVIALDAELIMRLGSGLLKNFSTNSGKPMPSYN